MTTPCAGLVGMLLSMCRKLTIGKLKVSTKLTIQGFHILEEKRNRFMTNGGQSVAMRMPVVCW